MNSYTATNPVAERAAGGLSPGSGDVSIARPHKCAKRLFVNHAGYCSRSAKACTERQLRVLSLLKVLSLSNGSNRSECSIARPIHSCEAALFPSREKQYRAPHGFICAVHLTLCEAQTSLDVAQAQKGRQVYSPGQSEAEAWGDDSKRSSPVRATQHAHSPPNPMHHRVRAFSRPSRPVKAGQGRVNDREHCGTHPRGTLIAIHQCHPASLFSSRTG